MTATIFTYLIIVSPWLYRSKAILSNWKCIKGVGKMKDLENDVVEHWGEAVIFPMSKLLDIC